MRRALIGLIFLLATATAASGATHTAATWAELVAANTAASNGDTIQLTAASYTQAAALTLSKNLTITCTHSSGVCTIEGDANDIIIAGQAAGTTQAWTGVVFDANSENRAACIVDTTAGNLTVTFTSCAFRDSNSTNGLTMVTTAGQAYNLVVSCTWCVFSGNANDGVNLTQDATATGSATCTLTDCHSHTNTNDGASPHANGTMVVVGGSYTNNGKNALVNTGASSVITATGAFLAPDATPTTDLVLADGGGAITLNYCRLVGDTDNAHGLLTTTGAGSAITANRCVLEGEGGADAKWIYGTGASTVTAWDCMFISSSTYAATASRAPIVSAATATVNVYRSVMDTYAATTGSTWALAYALGTLNLEGNAMIMGDISGDTATDTQYAAYFDAGSAGTFHHNTVLMQSTDQRPNGPYLIADNIVCRGNLLIQPYWGFRAGTANYYDGVAGSGYNVILDVLAGGSAVLGDTPIGTDVTAGTTPVYWDTTAPGFDLRLKTRGAAAGVDPTDSYLISYDGYSGAYGTTNRESGGVGTEVDAGAYTVATGNGLSAAGTSGVHVSLTPFASSVGPANGVPGSVTGGSGVHAGGGSLIRENGVHAR